MDVGKILGIICNKESLWGQQGDSYDAFTSILVLFKLDNNFKHNIETETTCHKGHTSPKMIEKMYGAVSLDVTDSTQSLKDAIDLTCNENHVPDYECIGCKHKTNATMNFRYNY